jgi:hypothetical protein
MTCCSFNATLMLEMLRGKRMLFVGDTLNRGQYVSLICMLHRAIPDGAKSFESVDALSIFRAKVYVTFLSVLVFRFVCCHLSVKKDHCLLTDLLMAPGLRRDDRVLLGADARGVQLRRRRGARTRGPGHPRRAHGQALAVLEGRPHPGLQLLPLVDDGGEDPDPVNQSRPLLSFVRCSCDLNIFFNSLYEINWLTD